MSDYLIKLENASYKISRNYILENLSFQVGNKEIVTIVGPNGSGKSTLAKIMSKILKPTSGSILFKKDIKIGYVPQKFYYNNSIPITVQGFLDLYLLDKEQNFSSRWAQKLNVTELLNFPITSLSGGQMQKILIARALMSYPDILVLDEPTQGLDMFAQIEFYEFIDYIKNTLNISIILVSHDLYFVMKNSTIVLCLNRHMCCIGTPEEMSDNQIYEKIFGHNASKVLSIYKHHHDHFHK